MLSRCPDCLQLHVRIAKKEHTTPKGDAEPYLHIRLQMEEEAFDEETRALEALFGLGSRPTRLRSSYADILEILAIWSRR